MNKLYIEKGTKREHDKNKTKWIHKRTDMVIKWNIYLKWLLSKFVIFIFSILIIII